MGPGDMPSKEDLESAFQLGKMIAHRDWVLLTGGRNAGVMDAASKGASEHGGLVIGILPDEDRSRMSSYVDIPIVTGVGSARNNINILTSDVIIACGTGAGTFSEIMLALKAGKHVIVLNQSDEAISFLQSLESDLLHEASDVSEVIKLVERVL